MADITSSTRTATDSQKTLAFLEHLFPSPRQFDIRLWDGTLVTAEGKAEFTLALNSPYAIRHIFSLPIELRMGEAYARGDFDIDGDIMAALKTMAGAGIFTAVGYVDAFSTTTYNLSRVWTLFRLWQALPTESGAATLAREAVNAQGESYSRGRSQQVVQYHYDISNEFYALWLGKRMTYSCAYFVTGKENIDQAQALKMEYLCRKLQLKPGERLLDIGCGWGGLVIYAAKYYSANALGITLSQQQFDLAAKRVSDAGLSDKITIKMMDYREVNEAFDKIVSVGMFEHVGRTHLWEYFGQAFKLLKPGGLFLNQGISSTYEAPRSLWTIVIEKYIMGRGEFAQKFVLPDGDVIPVSKVNLVAEEAGLEVRDVENIRDHWVLTLREWIRLLEANKTEAVRLVGETAYRIWRIYLYSSMTGFALGSINECQSLFVKPANGQSGLALTRPPLEADSGR